MSVMYATADLPIFTADRTSAGGEIDRYFCLAPITSMDWSAKPWWNREAIGSFLLDPEIGASISSGLSAMGAWIYTLTGNIAHTSEEHTLVLVPVHEPAPATATALLERVHERSGLTWEQIARALGVSKRSIHLWAGGGKLNGRNMEALASLDALVAANSGDGPEYCRAALLTAAPGAASPLAAWSRRQGQAIVGVNTPILSPVDLMGNTEDAS